MEMQPSRHPPERTGEASARVQEGPGCTTRSSRRSHQEPCGVEPLRSVLHCPRRGGCGNLLCVTYSRWLLADLQVHTPADRAQRYGDVGGPDPNEEFADRLVEAHANAGVTVMAVTDHNRIDWWPVLAAAGARHGVTVFPGLEINVNKCHLLMVWDCTGDGYALAGRFLGGLFEPGVDPLTADRTPRAVSTGSVLDLARRAGQLNGLVLAPHATAAGMGLFGKNVCNVSSEVAQSGLILGFDVVGSNRADVLTNPRSQFGDIAPAWFASGDTRDLADVGQRCVYLKLGPRPTLESLRQAFLMPATRIRFPGHLRSNWQHVRGVRFLEAPAPTWPRLTSVTVQGGFHDSLEVQFGPGLNAIIGGKGTGKSTLVEILRYTLGAPESIAPPPQAKEGVTNRQANFPANAEATVAYTAADGEEYRITRVGGASSPARLHRGAQTLDVEPSRRVRLRVFGQRELSELHRQPEALARFVLPHDGDAARGANSRVQEALRAARSLAEQLDELDAQAAASEEQAEELRDVQDRLGRLAEHGAAVLVAASQQLGAAETAVTAALAWPDELDTANASLRTAAAPDLPDHPLLPGAMASLLTAARVSVDGAADAVQLAASDLRTGLREPAEEWKATALAERERLGRALADAGLTDPGELATLQKRETTLMQALAGADQREQRRQHLLGERREALEELAAARRAHSRLVDEAVRTLNERTGPRVRVLTQPLADSRPLRTFLTDVLGKRPTDEQMDRLTRPGLPGLVQALNDGKQALRVAGLTPAQADRLLELTGVQRHQLEEVDTPDAVTVEVDLGTEGTPRWTPLEDVSPGQAATAMLELALVSGDEPVIIDQPEDDLDNRFIYQEVVRQIAEVSQRRQVIVATHNANIPVLGDAELILALEATTGRGSTLACGGLDDPSVAEVARSILEGGDEAFTARARRYARP